MNILPFVSPFEIWGAILIIPLAIITLAGIFVAVISVLQIDKSLRGKPRNTKHPRRA